MQFSHFEKEIDRLKSVYTAGMSAERVKLLWEKFRNVPDHVFTNALNHMISEYTTQTLPAMSRFAEAVGMFKINLHTSSMMMEHLTPFKCEPCRDFGFGFVGDTVVVCVCDTGRSINPERLAKEQRNYDTGKKLFMRPDKFKLKALPYDPNERINA